jgi:hypothetical protein
MADEGMADDAASKLFSGLSEACVEALEKQDVHGAVVAGISAYLLFRDMKQAQLADDALDLIQTAIASRPQEKPEGHRQIECSFCGRGQHEVRLGAGPDVFICHECAATMVEALAAPR